MRKVVAGNWKMHHGPRATRSFLEAFRPTALEAAAEVILFPPALSLSTARDTLQAESAVRLGAQNVHPAASGAFTGELSAEMAREAGAEFALVGHSERRKLFGETDAETARKVEAVRRGGLIPLLCVGETLEERRDGRLRAVLVRQLEAGLSAEGEAARISAGEPFLLAYEPVWAIGTGETATPEDASEAHAILREVLAGIVAPDRVDSLPILYGGSVTPKNAGVLMGAPGVDGVLVGGASLDPDSFGRILAAARAS